MDIKEQTKKLEDLCYRRKSVAEQIPGINEEAAAFCEGYKAFLDAAKTEREAAAWSERALQSAGYSLFRAGASYQSGDKIYFIHKEKCVIATTIGTQGLESGVRLNISHIDSPRLDLRPLPLYENGNFAFFRTHYYGGLRKYQWATVPLALHGVILKQNGEKQTICIGEDENDPVFCITDLLPHLAAKQNERKLPEGIKGEELNVLIASLPIDDPDAKKRVKLNVLSLLNQKYGICESDFIRAELEMVPAQKARDVGVDKSMIGAYGHDDRVDAYPALMAEIASASPTHTTVCVLTDKEETGSDGVTGANSMYIMQFFEQLCACQNADFIRTLQASKCLSADVTAAYDPNWADAFEPSNATYAGQGIALCKYTGARGKSSTSDASAELVAWTTGLFDANGVAWQLGEMGKIDLGGGGTVAKFIAQHNVETIDVGVPVLSMHSPFEVVAKNDVLMAYRAFLSFNK